MQASEEAEKKRVFKKLCRKSGKTILEHNMLSHGDRLLVGLSGGKDSLALLEILKDRQKSVPFHFEIMAAHIKVADVGHSADEQYLSEFCRSLDIPLFIEETQANISDNTKKSPCFLCSWHRRKKLFDLTRTLNCNKLSFGHHRDDALETFMINMLYHGSVSSLPYNLKMFDGRVHLIRPLLDIWEEDIEQYNRLRKFKPMESGCAYENNTKRKYVRGIIENLNLQYPKSKINMFKAMGNIYPEYLPQSAKEK